MKSLKKVLVALVLAAVCVAGSFAQGSTSSAKDEIYYGKIVLTKAKGAKVATIVTKKGTYVLTTQDIVTNSEEAPAGVEVTMEQIKLMNGRPAKIVGLLNEESSVLIVTGLFDASHPDAK